MSSQVKRAACYIRVSTDDQIEYSPDSQLREMRAYAERSDMIILDEYIYVDEGISGRKAAKRPSFQNMIATAKRKPKPFDVVLLYKFSRFARNREDSVVYKSILRKKCGIEVISITEPLDSDNKMSIIMEAFIEAMDEYYSVNLSEDVKRTMTEKAMRGELQATPAFGYTVKDNALVPIPEEANLVKEIFTRFVNNEEGYFSIARWLNDIGIRTRRGNPFENRTVEYILRNPVYIGKLRWTPTGKTLRDFENPDSIVVDGCHEPLIDNDTWESAQSRVCRIKSQWGKYRKPAALHKDWLSGVLRCAVCGATIVKAGQYWRCNGYAHGKCTISQNITDDALKHAFIEGIEASINSKGLLSYKVIPKDGNTSGSDVYTAQLKKIPDRLKRAREAYLSGADTLEEYKQTKLDLEQEEKRLSKLVKGLQSRESVASGQKKIRDALRQMYEILIDPTSTLEDKHKAVHGAVFSGSLSRDDNLIVLEYQLTV